MIKPSEDEMQAHGDAAAEADDGSVETTPRPMYRPDAENAEPSGTSFVPL